MEKFARKRTWSNGLNLVTHVILIAFFGDPFVDFVSMGYLKPAKIVPQLPVSLQGGSRAVFSSREIPQKVGI